MTRKFDVGDIDREQMVCPCCGRVFNSDEGGMRYCPFCIRYCDGDGCYFGKETIKGGQPYLIRNGQRPGNAVYSRCEDPLLARAELLTTVDSIEEKNPELRSKAIYGFYDVDPTFGVEDFLKDYSSRELKLLVSKMRQLRSQGWKYKRTERALPLKCLLPQKSGSCLKSLSNDATELRAEFADFLLGFPLSLQGSLNALRYLSRLFLILIER